MGSLCPTLHLPVSRRTVVAVAFPSTLVAVQVYVPSSPPETFLRSKEPLADGMVWLFEERLPLNHVTSGKGRPGIKTEDKSSRYKARCHVPQLSFSADQILVSKCRAPRWVAGVFGWHLSPEGGREGHVLHVRHLPHLFVGT